MESGQRTAHRLNLEKEVEAADDTDDTDEQALEVNCPRTCEVGPRPQWDSVVPPLHLRNRRNLRLSELPVSAWVHHSSIPWLARTLASPTATQNLPFPFFTFSRFFRPRIPGPPLLQWPHPGRTFLPKRTKEGAEGFRLFPTHERGSDGRWSGARFRPVHPEVVGDPWKRRCEGRRIC